MMVFFCGDVLKNQQQKIFMKTIKILLIQIEIKNK